ncbi:DNA-binding CsgD family transcriptional regulator [Actinoalloteichus hoggarensis]|uniref:Uncharacterized protein n=1 Tax=Actinoalloteichus hoggarensis TaxID=1470176 RepID=A0A221W515_9PSEU|nr:LuxR C-terminal-related transcriptional regulator [Actinoalloteichus hoggarensis]ASO20746.1 hypothetical protein AHOG_15600 [Actinoalloteichus hoggarensis]MBB5920676.1 DNA-binding CsgD family transcriptional regulator [Actinoalloteichus hoggarensis]
MSLRREWMVLDALDPDTTSGLVYRTLVSRPRARLDELVAETGLDVDVLHEVLRRLAAEHVTTRLDDGRWEARSPAEITGNIGNRNTGGTPETLPRRDVVRRAELCRSVVELERVFRIARRDGRRTEPLEAIDDPRRMLAVLRRLRAGTRRELRVIDRPPYFAPPPYLAAPDGSRPAPQAAGPACRTIYPESAFAGSRAPDTAALVKAGGQARLLRDPPLRLVIADDDLAVVTARAEDDSGPVSLVVRRSGLLTVLADTFETLWRLATPVSTVGGDRLDDERDRRILTLLAGGATDDAIARRLALSRRTVVRRVAALLDRLGAATRFQAGVQAARRGWL